MNKTIRLLRKLFFISVAAFLATMYLQDKIILWLFIGMILGFLSGIFIEEEIYERENEKSKRDSNVRVQLFMTHDQIRHILERRDELKFKTMGDTIRAIIENDMRKQ